jgi:hypothetical protein
MSSALFNFLQPPVTSCLFGLIFSAASCSQTSTACVLLLRCEAKFHTYAKQRVVVRYRTEQSVTSIWRLEFEHINSCFVHYLVI